MKIFIKKKQVNYLPNGIALLCCESRKWTLSEKSCNGRRTNGKSNVGLTTKFDGQCMIQ